VWDSLDRLSERAKVHVCGAHYSHGTVAVAAAAAAAPAAAPRAAAPCTPPEFAVIAIL
jgi:hypothetical protein